jgi:hypothetical protein
MALAERKEVKDYIGIYDCNTWTLLNVSHLYYDVSIVH